MIDILEMLLVYVLGTVISLIISGFLADRFVIRKVMRNKELQETLQVFRDGRELLKQIVEEQKRKRDQG